MIVSALELSTYHVKKSTMDALDNMLAYDNGTNPHGIFPFDYGWFLFVREESDFEQEELNDIMKYAFKNNCMYVVLDRDGEIIHDLPTFDHSN